MSTKAGPDGDQLDAQPLVEETTTQVRIYIFITEKQEPFYASHLWEGSMYIHDPPPPGSMPGGVLRYNITGTWSHGHAWQGLAPSHAHMPMATLAPVTRHARALAIGAGDVPMIQRGSPVFRRDGYAGRACLDHARTGSIKRHKTGRTFGHVRVLRTHVR
jgi:hypothetical protein